MWQNCSCDEGFTVPPFQLTNRIKASLLQEKKRKLPKERKRDFTDRRVENSIKTRKLEIPEKKMKKNLLFSISVTKKYSWQILFIVSGLKLIAFFHCFTLALNLFFFFSGKMRKLLTDGKIDWFLIFTYENETFYRCYLVMVFQHLFYSTFFENSSSVFPKKF